MDQKVDQIDLERFTDALRKDYSKLSIRIRELSHSVKCECNGVTLRVHFPTINQGKAAIWELLNVILDYMTPFALQRIQIDEVNKDYGKISEDDYRIKCERLQREAISLFIRAQKETNRNGEAGELLLFILTEWILEAPQLLAKLPLKTNRNVPVHGTDGIHVGYLPAKKTLCIYWGESKLYRDVNQAIAKAVESIEKAIKPESVEYELALVRRNIDSVGLSPAAKSLMLSFLNPFDSENYNKLINATTCLIGFDFDGYGKLNADSDEQQFGALALAKLKELGPRVATALKQAGLGTRLVEIFFFPLPSVEELRNQFQTRIGWNNDSGSS